MVIVIRRFQAGDTMSVVYLSKVYDEEGGTETLWDADANYPKVTIKDPNGVVKVDAASMTKLSTGKYVYRYTLAATCGLGWWNVKVDNKITISAVPYYEASFGGFGVD